MDGLPRSGRGARARVAAVAGCCALITAGALLTGTPASATTCATPVPLSGLAESLHIPGVGLLHCTTADRSTMDAASSSTPAAPLSTPSSATPTAPTTDLPADPSAGTGADPAGDGTTVSAQSAGSSSLAALTLVRGSTVVYPVKDGYLDTVKFAVHPSNAVGAGVAVVGIAEILHGTTVVKRWNVGSSDFVATWNGRVGNRIEPGLYEFQVTAWTADGSTRTSTTHIRVSGEHLVKQSLVITRRVRGDAAVDRVPRRLLKAYRMGEVSVRDRTDAVVHGRAYLVFTGPGGTWRIRLRNGVHSTPTAVVPQGFETVTISHDWAKGAATLKSLTSIWSYWSLV